MYPLILLWLPSQKPINNILYGIQEKAVTFKPQEQMCLPAICVAEPERQCDLLLFTLEPSSKPHFLANNVLRSILDEDLQTSPIEFQERGVQSTAYQVNFWKLIGLGW